MSGSPPQAGDELILHAAENGDLSCLIAEEADVNHVHSQGLSALRIAELIQGVIAADVNHVDTRGLSNLMIAAGNGDAGTVTSLIESGASVNLLLTESSGIWDSCARSALLEATRHGHTEVVKILLRRGAMADLRGSGSPSALSIAARNGDSEIVSLLIESGANVNLLSSYYQEYSPLYSAAAHAHVAIVAKLIRAGADVNLVVNNRGRTALMGAALRPRAGTDFPRIYRRQMETISLLIQAGANINAVSDDGETALLNAVDWDVENPVRVLIAYGANVNQATSMGTPLMKARGDINIGRALILAGAETRNIPANIFNAFLRPSMVSLDALVTHRSSLITTAFVRLKYTSEPKENMFKNSEFRDSFHEWDDLRIAKVSRIVSFLVTLETEDLHVTYILAPFLANADLERLNRFGLVLSFLTAPCGGKETALLEISKCSAEPEQIRFNQATLRYAIIMGSFKPSSDSFLDPMYAVYSNLIADLAATAKGLRRIGEINIGTVYQFRHGEFGIYSKFAENLNQILISM